MDIVGRYWRLREENARLRSVGGTTTHGKRLIGIPKLEDANQAGTKDAAKCTLIITEGDSAKALAVAGLSVVGRDLYGVYPLRGKFLNVRDAAHQRVVDNKEVAELKKIIGLRDGVDYSTPAARSSLRYGHVMLMTDQDADGSHIKGLFINFIHVLWPSLVHANGFLLEFVTPLIKASRGKVERPFFSMSEYASWQRSEEATTGGAWRVKYYKGLGTSTSLEARGYFGNLQRHVKEFVWRAPDDDAAIELAFEKGDGSVATDKRKRWLEKYDPTVFVDRAFGASLSYSDFVNKELVAFSYSSNLRAIPHVLDGLKVGQRKVLYACFRKPLRAKEEIKLVQLAGYVSEVASYHHGEAALQQTIVNLAQSFVGSGNNVPLLNGIGQFGTRLQGGKDAASARYIFCAMGDLTRDIFLEADEPLLQAARQDDGEDAEPLNYLPVVPMLLINGSQGLGTGWSTSIPPYNPLEVVDAVLAVIESRPVAALIPWFRGYGYVNERMWVDVRWRVLGARERRHFLMRNFLIQYL